MKKLIILMLVLGATLQGCAQNWVIRSDGNPVIIVAGADTLKVKDTATVVVVPNPQLRFGLTPVSQTIAYGGTVTFNALAADGYTPYSLMWYYLGGSVGSGNSFTKTNAITSGNVRVDATDAHGTVISATAVLTVLPPPSLLISAQPVGVMIDSNASCTFSVSASGYGALHYAWQFNNSAVGMDASVLTMTGNNLSGNVKCVVSDALSRSITSDTAHLGFSGGSGSSQNNHYTFTLAAPSIISAGLYKGDTLITPLYNNLYHLAGTFDSFVTKKADNLSTIPDGVYTVKLLSNNVSYRQIGVYANSSTNQNGNDHWRGEQWSDICFTSAGHGYVSLGYSEDSYSLYGINTSDVGKKEIIYQKESYAYTNFLCTDDSVLYVSEISTGGNGFDINKQYNYVYGLKIYDSSNSVVNFSYGFPYNGGAQLHQNNVFDTVGTLVRNDTAYPKGIGVQRGIAGKFLFVARNNVHVSDRRTGQLLNVLNLKLGRLTVSKDNNFVWAVANGHVEKYSINQANGSLTYTSVHVGDGMDVTALDCSFDNTQIKVSDNITQKVYTYNANDGSLIAPFGQGGYYENVMIYNDKWMFRSDRVTFRQCLAYQPDASWWVADNGNNRYQHFSASNTYVNNIFYLPQNYTLSVNPQDETQLYTGYQMIRINKDVDPKVGWTAEQNYLASMPVGADEHLIQHPVTGTNGKVYCTIRYGNDNEYTELATFGIRRTGVFFSQLGGSGWQQMDVNMDLIMSTAYSDGKFARYRKKFIGFDSNQNPLFENNFTIEAVFEDDEATPGFATANLRARTPDGGFIHFKGNTRAGNGYATGYHFGKVKLGGTSFLWQTMNSTTSSYNGEYPRERFDVGNAVNDYGGSVATVTKDGKKVQNQYHGENWGASKGAGQVNFVNDYEARTGLQIGQFGVVALHNSVDAAYLKTGNTQDMATIQRSNGRNLWLEQDESFCAGVMVIEDSNNQSIKMDSFTVKIQSPLIITTPYLALLDSLPTEGVLYGKTGRVFVSDSTRTIMSVSAGYNSYEPSKDINILTKTQGAYKVAPFTSIDLGTNNLASFKIDGSLSLPGGQSNNINYYHGQNYLDILDSFGKKAVRMEVTQASQGDYGNHVFRFNGVDIWNEIAIDNTYPYQEKINRIKIVWNGSTFSFQYGDYIVNNIPVAEAGANPSKIKTVISHSQSGLNGDEYITRMIDWKLWPSN